MWFSFRLAVASQCHLLLFGRFVLPLLTLTIGLAVAACYLHKKSIDEYPFGKKVEIACKLVR
jgi:hypothetical protein